MRKTCLILLLFAASGVFAQGSHDDTKWFDHFVREAANNRTTVQGDTVKVGFPANSDTTWSIRSNALKNIFSMRFRVIVLFPTAAISIFLTPSSSISPRCWRTKAQGRAKRKNNCSTVHMLLRGKQ